MRTFVLLLTALCSLLSASAQVAQLQWDIQQDRPVPHDVLLWQGETVDLLPRLVQGTAPVAVTNAAVEFRYREASLATNVFRSVAAAANTNTGVISVRWFPDYDAGAPWYDYQVIVGSNAANPRIFGRITMRPTIGWHASTNPPPAVALYPSRAELQAASNAFAAALQGEGNARAAADLTNAAAIAAFRPNRLWSDDGTRFVDGTGGVWRVTSAADTSTLIVISNSAAFAQTFFPVAIPMERSQETGRWYCVNPNNPSLGGAVYMDDFRLVRYPSFPFEYVWRSDSLSFPRLYYPDTNTMASGWAVVDYRRYSETTLVDNVTFGIGFAVHTNDAVRHITADERKAWNAAASHPAQSGARESRSFVLTYPTASSDTPLWRANTNLTVNAVHVLCVGGTSITGQLWEYDANGAAGSAVGADIVATAGANADDDGRLSHAGLAAGNYLGWKTTGVSGAPARVIVSYEFTID